MTQSKEKPHSKVKNHNIGNFVEHVAKATKSLKSL